MNKLIGVSRWCSWSSAAGRAPMPTGIGAPSTTYGPAAINLADLYRQLGRDGDGESVLRAAIAASPQDAGLHHALGLALTRLKRRDESLGELRRAAELDRDRARYAYVYAVGLHSAGHVDEAMTVLKESLAGIPATATLCWRSSASAAMPGILGARSHTPSNWPARRQVIPASSPSTRIFGVKSRIPMPDDGYDRNSSVVSVASARDSRQPIINKHSHSSLPDHCLHSCAGTLSAKSF
jgi:tetratricopeptide (TPR) repeat protein